MISGIVALYVKALHKFGYGQRLALHQILAVNVTHASDYYMLGTTTILHLLPVRP